MSDIRNLDKNINILVIDDLSTVRKIVKNCLNKLGFKNITEAEDGSSALERLTKDKFDLVITDWHMPDMFAQDIISTIDSESSKVPFIMLINEAQKKEIVKKETPDNATYIVKPITVGTLESKITQLL